MEELARQIKAATDPLTKQLEKLYELIRELQQDAPRRSDETSVVVQDPSRPRGDRFDSKFPAGTGLKNKFLALYKF